MFMVLPYPPNHEDSDLWGLAGIRLIFPGQEEDGQEKSLADVLRTSSEKYNL